MAKYYTVNTVPRTFKQVEKTGLFTEEDRMDDGRCYVCGGEKWIVMPDFVNEIDNGGNGKQNVMCCLCLSLTHL